MTVGPTDDREQEDQDEDDGGADRVAAKPPEARSGRQLRGGARSRRGSTVDARPPDALSGSRRGRGIQPDRVAGPDAIQVRRPRPPKGVVSARSRFRVW
ncbi:MAG TPA: hypothetical protein VG476_15640 [Acidimicrobiales bacterium]|nr:hypothetical protein [Acidimicrobiales bacterium]